MDISNSPSVRVLVRSPSLSTATSASSSQTLLSPSHTSSDPSTSSSSSPSPSRLSEGVVIVGFVGRIPDDSFQLINRIVDSNVFGSGNLDKQLNLEKEEVQDWFKRRRISYYHEEDRGILFLQFSSVWSPDSDDKADYDSAIEEHDFGDLQGLLFMFSVCHVIIYIQEGSRFDTNILKKFRALQSAKHALIPFVKSRATPPLPSRPHSSSASRSAASATVSNNSSPSRSGSNSAHNASGISLMSGLGSYTSLFPGQCSPVILFVFIDDFSDAPSGCSNVEGSTDTVPLNPSSSSDSISRANLPAKGSGSVVVLARPVSKLEGGFRKKLQSSLEAQIRFLIKKCRTLTGSETSHAGSRGGGASNSAPLFSLDASKAVVLVDRSSNRRAESLEFSTSLVEDVLNGKATSDSLLLESLGQSASKEDIVSLKEFIYRQSDILRGRGGLVSNANSGSAAGVGMVAVAAAAAAASVASGKTFTTPELPSIEIWTSSSQLILHGILSAKSGCIDEVEISKRKPRHRHIVPPLIEGNALKGMDPLDIAVSWLESGKGLRMKFSTSWCERTLPAAKEVYLRDLPACYPTSQHEAHLEKSLLAFRSMVKGPAVQYFVKKLEEECKSIWYAGRQLCDAVSLTGKPCMHQRHVTETGDPLSETLPKPHSSGYVFLHACACGRSRRLRSDPFDFESANVSFNRFADCDNFLPVVQLPELSITGPIQPSSWTLIRVGGAKYYEPSKGLLQSGFCATQKFLFKWKIITGIRKTLVDSTENMMLQAASIKSSMDSKIEPNVDSNVKRANTTQLKSGDLQPGNENGRNSFESMKSENKKSTSGKGIPNLTLRKPFSEVVAGSPAPDFGFPPLQQRRRPSSGVDKGFRPSKVVNSSEQGYVTVDHQGTQNSENGTNLSKNSNDISGNEFQDSDSFLQIGSNVVPMNVNNFEKTKNSFIKQTLAYIGFEHECPRGHRFLLNAEHLKELGSSYSKVKESHSSMESAACSLADPLKHGKSSRHVKVHNNVDAMIATSPSKARNVDKVKDAVASGNLCLNDQSHYIKKVSENNPTPVCATVSSSVKYLEKGVKFISTDDSGCGFLLNQNLPIFMNCQHCKLSKNEKDPPKMKFSGTISQLQRIFVVTPPFPVVLATYPVIQFEESCLPPTVPERQQKLQFALGCQVVLPPESFLTLRLPFVYGVQLEDGSLHPLNPLQHQPEETAWIIGGTTLQILSKSENLDEGSQT